MALNPARPKDSRPSLAEAARALEIRKTQPEALSPHEEQVRRCRLPRRMRERWAELRSDPEYLSAQDSLATLAALRGEYEERIPEGDSPTWRKKLLKDLGELRDSVASSTDPDVVADEIHNFYLSVKERVREDEVIAEIVKIALAESTIKSVEMRRVEKGGQVLTVAESLSLLQEVADIIDAVAVDPVKKAWGMRRVSAMMNRKASGGTLYQARPSAEQAGEEDEAEAFIPRAAEPEG